MKCFKVLTSVRVEQPQNWSDHSIFDNSLIVHNTVGHFQQNFKNSAWPSHGQTSFATLELVLMKLKYKFFLWFTQLLPQCSIGRELNLFHQLNLDHEHVNLLISDFVYEITDL